MIDVLRHRGPDDTGFYVDEDIALANARLSIIDIEGGHQPIQNEDGTVTVTYNGEIYNYRQLRHELELQGHSFRTKSDTEVIVHSYEQYGEAFVERLNGMFAIGLWDSKWKKLILARDRMGIKPLHYAQRENSLLFASEIKAILQAPFSRAVNPDALYAILNLGYVPGNGTLIDGICKLPPSSRLVFHEGTIRIEGYWQIPGINPTVDENELVDKLQVALEESIRDQLVADVPIGCFLSGGLDTSTIVAFASKASTQSLKTFCMGFGEETDEFRDARLIAERFGTDHHELTVDSSHGVKVYPRMVWHMEAPKYNLYPWFVCELVHKHVKVCLSGNGGDEIFGGYFARYENALKIEELSHNPLASLMRGIGGALQNVPDNIRTMNRLRALESLGDSTSEYLILAGVLPNSFNTKLFHHSPHADLSQHFRPFFENTDFLQGLINAELRTKLVDDLLSVDDGMSMAHSLELRVPLLDDRVVDLMANLPWRLKYRMGTHGKLLLRKAVREILPEESLRKPKWGFSVNVYSWYAGELGEVARQVIPESDVIRRYFSQSVIRKLLQRPLSQDDRRLYVLFWQLLGFHLWHKIFVESEDVRNPRLELEPLLA